MSSTSPPPQTPRPRHGIAWWLSPLRPVVIGMVVLAIVLVIAKAKLPGHTVVVWQDAGHQALAASDSDVEVVVLLAGFVVLGIWLVCSLVMAITPLRHVLVPNPTYWKTPQNQAEMRRRYAAYFGRAIGGTYVFIAAELLLGLLSQHIAALEVAWAPTVVSIAYIVGLLIFAVWVFSDGFRAPRRAPQRPQAGSVRR